MKRSLLALGGTLMAGSLILTACAGQTATPAAPTTAPKAAAPAQQSPAAPAPTTPPAAKAASPAAPATSPAAKTASPAAAAPSPVAKTAASPAAGGVNATAAKIDNFDTRFADLIARAKQEGSLMLYHTTIVEPTIEFVAEFEKRFPGIKVERFRAVAGPLHERFRTEARSGRPVADIVYASNLALMQGLVRENLIAQYTPASAAAYPADLKIENYSYPLYLIRIGGVLYNTDLVSAADAQKLQTWEGLLDPAFRNSLIVVNPAAAGSQFPVWYMFLEGMKQRFGPAFVEKIAAQNPVVMDSAATASQRVAAGEYAVLVGGPDEAIYPLLERNAPVRIAWPPPTGVGPQMVAIAEGAPHPNAARLYLEWVMSEEGQRVHASKIGPSYLSAVGRQHPATQAPGWVEPAELYIPPIGSDANAQQLNNEWKRIFGVP